MLASLPGCRTTATGITSPNNCIPKSGGGDFSSKSSPQETSLKSRWPELGHVHIPKVVMPGKRERAGLQEDPL